MIKWLPQTTKLFHHWAAVIVCISSLGLFSRYVLWAACSERTRFIRSFIRYVWSGHSAQGLVTFVPPHSPGHGVDQNEWGRSGRGRARSAEKWTVGEAKNTPVIPLGSAEPKCSDQVQHFRAEGLRTSRAAVHEGFPEGRLYWLKSLWEPGDVQSQSDPRNQGQASLWQVGKPRPVTEVLQLTLGHGRDCR